MRSGGDPKSTLAILQRLVLSGEVNAVTLVALTILLSTLRKASSMDTELGGNCCIGLDPVGESIFTILDDAIYALVAHREP